MSFGIGLAKVLDELEHSGMSVEAFAKKIRCSKTSLYHYKNQRAAASKLRVSEGEVLSLQLKTDGHTVKEELTKLRYGELELSFNELPHPLWIATLIKELKR